MQSDIVEICLLLGIKAGLGMTVWQANPKRQSISLVSNLNINWRGVLQANFIV